MKYYKLKTVAFYIFVATVISFDLKGSENENEGICPCCCSDEGEKKGEKEEGEEKNNENKEDTKDKKKKEDKKEGEEGEGGEGGEENKEDTKDKKKEGEKKDEEKKEGEGGEGGEGGDDGGYEGGDEGKEEEEGEEGGDEGGDEEKKDEEEEENEGEDYEEEEDDDDENFILGLKQCFDSVINKEKFKTYVGKKEGMKERLFIVDLKEGWNEIVFEKLKDNLSELFSYKEKWSEKKLLLNNLSLISYCPKNENDKESKILEFEMDPNSTINQVFDYFKNASTWVNEGCLILFIKDQDGSIVSLTSIYSYGEYIYTIYKDKQV